METEIKKIQQQFKTKLFTGDYKITSKSEHVFIIEIENKMFNIWMGNINIPNTRTHYDSFYNFLDLEFTTKEKIRLHEILAPIYSDYITTELIKKKKAELKKLEELC